MRQSDFAIGKTRQRGRHLSRLDSVPVIAQMRTDLLPLICHHVATAKKSNKSFPVALALTSIMLNISHDATEQAFSLLRFHPCDISKDCSRDELQSGEKETKQMKIRLPNRLLYCLQDRTLHGLCVTTPI